MGADGKKEKIKILQVSNISVTATKDQIFTMFQYIGRIEEMKVYPSDMNITSATTSKCAFIKYDDERAVEVGQHLTNTVLIDRAVVCAPFLQSVIPDEATFTATGGPVTAGQRQLPPHVTNRIQELDDGTSVLLTVDPQMEALGLPTYPPLPGNTDLAKVEEIRRTIYVGNLPKGVDGQAVLDFFNSYVGEVMYLRMAIGPDTLPCAYAYVEFTNQTSVPIALQNNGIDFQGRPLRIQHSRVAIIKPQAKSADQALEEVEEAIRMGKNGRSRSRSPLRRRRTPSPSPRRKSRSPRRRRSRSRSRSRERKRSRTRSKERKRSRSRDKKRSRSREKRRSRSRERRSRRSRSRDKKRDRSRSRDRKKEKEKDKKDRKRSKSRDRKKEKESKRDHSSERKKDKDKDRKEKDKPKEGKVDNLDEETLRERLLEKAAVRSGKEGSESDRESDLDKGGDKTPSRIKNERKRRHSDSD
ncbi:RRM [Parelaphostrongylus tenuis]|uniref:RRM n=1 Tax=Parelaphostrongylus tenuis TaxID=148309 RepID=A0AAD5QRM4_PARTN|nr:RRM [Parelaphostrongylus tenuis]